MSRKALVVIDIQNDITRHYFSISGDYFFTFRSKEEDLKGFYC